MKGICSIWQPLVLALALVSLRAWADDLPPCASQVGPSCAFYGNIPALTLHTGIDISASTEFIRPIYGLHRGDFQFQRSFHKSKFYELFSIPYTSTEVVHPALPKQQLLREVEKMIAQTFDPGLQKGQMFSLRSIGVFGGPHNTLLLARTGETYQVHDPFPGVIRTFTRAELAAKILIASSKTRHDPQPRYVTHYLTIAASPAPVKAVKTLKDLPNTLTITLTASQRLCIQQGLRSQGPQPDNDDITSLVKSYPALDFAVIPASGNKETYTSAIAANLKQEQRFGLIRLAQFHLNVWKLGHRNNLSVLFLNGKPQAFVGYRKSDLGLILAFDNGSTITEHHSRDVLAMLHHKTPVHATIQVAQ